MSCLQDRRRSIVNFLVPGYTRARSPYHGQGHFNDSTRKTSRVCGLLPRMQLFLTGPPFASLLFACLMVCNHGAAAAAADLEQTSCVGSENRVSTLFTISDSGSARPDLFGVVSRESIPWSESYDDGIELTPLTRSLLIPGWGQFSEGRKVKGTLFFSVSLAAVALAIHNNARANDSYDRYRRETGPEMIQHYRHRTEHYDEKRNQAIIIALGNHVLNLLDIIFFNDGQPASHLSFSMGLPPPNENDNIPCSGFSFFCRLAF